MADKIKVSYSDLEDVFELASNLRQDDINELQALYITPFKSLLQGYIFSDECFTAKFKSEVIGMFGYSGYSMPCNIATIWFLGSDEMVNHPIAFVKQGRYYVEKFLEKYSVLTNIADKRNVSHINWLKHIGMTFSKSVNINGYEFLEFYKKRKDK